MAAYNNTMKEKLPMPWHIVAVSPGEVLYGAKQNFIDACKKYGVKYTVREHPGMIHCYAMLPYFRESKEDFEEIAQILAK